ncbi:MAG: SDR family NAD(P)-dependent oxidoreductase, partial [Cyanobacteria bacterium M_surface_7_m2_040]|nr:SDR family NAD(P)-dependent oxidoreductase [Cyanobacteria bacterium M_surface_7_m2_040]
MPAPVCVVVGYGAGVGHGIAAAFARQGSDLLLLGRSPERHGAALAELRELGVEVTTEAVDAADPEALAAVLAVLPGEGPVVLAYN